MESKFKIEKLRPGDTSVGKILTYVTWRPNSHLHCPWKSIGLAAWVWNPRFGEAETDPRRFLTSQ